MDIISYIHKSVELFSQILGLIEVWTHRSMELSPQEYIEAVSKICRFIAVFLGVDLYILYLMIGCLLSALAKKHIPVLQIC